MKLENFDAVLDEVKTRFADLKSAYDKHRIVKTKKQLSEDISALFETAMENLYEDVEAPKKDSEPDLRKNGKGVELKTTEGEQWRGGEYSKRPSQYLLISWDLVDQDLKFFVASLYLEEEDWKTSTSDKYYATIFGKKEIISRIENQKNVDILSGEVYTYNRGKQKCIKVIKT